MKAKIRVVFLLTVLFLLVILSGCVAPESPATTPIQTETPVAPTELTLKIGETAKLPGIEVTVISVNKTDSISVDYPWKVNDTFFLVDVEIKNTGDKGIMFIGNPFQMNDAAGFSHSQESYDPYKHKDTLGTNEDLYPAHTRRGKILFRVPREAEGLKIELNFNNLYTPDYKKLPIEVKSVSWKVE
ncbi:MAG: DUF4352 domain-containing protein [Candidatus Methanoperedens sp.]